MDNKIRGLAWLFSIYTAGMLYLVWSKAADPDAISIINTVGVIVGTPVGGLIALAVWRAGSPDASGRDGRTQSASVPGETRSAIGSHEADPATAARSGPEGLGPEGQRTGHDQSRQDLGGQA